MDGLWFNVKDTRTLTDQTGMLKLGGPNGPGIEYNLDFKAFFHVILPLSFDCIL